MYEKVERARYNFNSFSRSITSDSYSNAFTVNEGDGVVQYPSFEAFSVEDIMHHIGFYMHNGLSPSPKVSYKFDSPDKKE